MTKLPDWLVERAALGEVPEASAQRLASADPEELADRIATLHAENQAELAAYPAGPAVAQIEAQVAKARERRTTRRRRIAGTFAAMAGAAAIALVVMFVSRSAVEIVAPDAGVDDPTERIKGSPLRVFRHAGEKIEELDHDMLARFGDVLQLRYSAGGKRHGLIASIDGAGAVTLHFPATEDASTALATGSNIALPNAYALDDAPRFERFFFLTSDAPLDVKRTMATLGAFARRGDSATATPELPTGVRQWSLRLRKPDRSSTP